MEVIFPGENTCGTCLTWHGTWQLTSTRVLPHVYSLPLPTAQPLSKADWTFFLTWLLPHTLVFDQVWILLQLLYAGLSIPRLQVTEVPTPWLSTRSFSSLQLSAARSALAGVTPYLKRSDRSQWARPLVGFFSKKKNECNILYFGSRLIVITNGVWLTAAKYS